MVEMMKFETEFVNRTINILEEYKGPHSFSNLINCTLGLIILPYENISVSDIWEVEIDKIDFLKGVYIKIFNPISKIRRGEPIYDKKTLFTFLKKLRNGLAHQNIIPINNNGKLEKVEIFNKYFEFGDLRVVFTENQLRKFALGIARAYLDE
ncbi:MAG: HEPN family nuclease [Candidatus Lokiarchaeota archaeon]|nr:HEPN family nuclease [Candidatus Lokiarchaeota archaeon]